MKINRIDYFVVKIVIKKINKEREKVRRGR